MCEISLEHAISFTVLLTSDCFTSAICLIRLQYESLVRSIWCLYAALDASIEIISNELTIESENKANKLPMLGDMLKQIEGKAPQHLLEKLLEIKHYSWKPSSSFIHAGLHARNRHSEGYPLGLLEQVLKNSNGMLAMVAQMFIILTGVPQMMERIHKLYKGYADCFPVSKD
ncbi:hypothetical protein HYN46_10710 [Aquirhabdus parva]|uniref:Uncharacterized protein n=2 Tax=Aquirhabdus parva TaxID=2283318 RepID=A0A345PBJ6_9GAMM|nr:hypothetical protein HYN46_10710 [Aquirhabdus parva]